MPSELLHAYLLLSSERKVGKKFFSFYNCKLCTFCYSLRPNDSELGGDNSGASQAHKHIQFVPLDDESGPPIERLARQAQLEFAG